jgi:hypothetical protein
MITETFDLLDYRVCFDLTDLPMSSLRRSDLGFGHLEYVSHYNY